MRSTLLLIGCLSLFASCASNSEPTRFGPVTAAEIEPFLPTNIDSPEHMECVRKTALQKAVELGDPKDIPKSKMVFVQEGNRPLSGDTKRLIVANNVVLEAVSACHGEFK